MWIKFKPFTEYIDIRRYTGYEGRPGDWKTALESNKSEYFSMAEGCIPQPGSLLDWNNNDDATPCGLYFIRIKDDSALHLTKSGYFDYIGMASGEQTQSQFQRGIFGRLFDHYRKLCCLPERGSFNKLIQKYRFGLEDEDKQLANRPRAIRLLEEQTFENIDQLRIFFASPHLKNNDEGNSIRAASIGEYGITENFLNVFKQCRETNNLNTFAGIQEFFRNKVELSFFIVPGRRGPKFPQKVAKGEGLALATYIQKYGGTPFLNDRNEVQGFNTLPPNLKK